MVEEGGRAIGERRDEVVEVDRAMVLLKDSPSGDVHNGDVALGFDVSEEATQVPVPVPKNAIEKDVDGAERRSKDWLGDEGMQEATEGVVRHGVLTNYEEVEGGDGHSCPKGDDGDGVGWASEVIRQMPSEQNFPRGADGRLHSLVQFGCRTDKAVVIDELVKAVIWIAADLMWLRGRAGAWHLPILRKVEAEDFGPQRMT